LNNDGKLFAGRSWKEEQGDRWANHDNANDEKAEPPGANPSGILAKLIF
jgi:hypothetical protein